MSAPRTNEGSIKLLDTTMNSFRSDRPFCQAFAESRRRSCGSLKAMGYHVRY
jgi:hypothetical protein